MANLSPFDSLVTPLTFAPLPPLPPLPPFLDEVPSPPDAPQASTWYFPVIGTCHSWTPFVTCTSWSTVPLYPSALTGPFFPVAPSVVKLYHPSYEPKLSKRGLLCFSKTRELWNLKAAFTIAFSLPSIIVFITNNEP